GTALYRGMVELNTGSPDSGVLSLIGAVSVALALAAGVGLGGEFVRAFQSVGLSASGRWARPAARRTRGFWPGFPRVPVPAGTCAVARGRAATGPVLSVAGATFAACTDRETS